MEIHGEIGAIVSGDAMTQDTPGRVVLHTADGVEEIDVDCSEGLYHLNVRASPLPFVETDTHPPRAPIGSERYKSRRYRAGAKERTGHRHRKI